MTRKSGIASFVLLLIFLVVHILFGFDGLYGQDSYEYLRYSNCLLDYLLHGNPPGDYFWPVGYPLLGAIFSLLLVKTGAALVFISFASLLISFYYSNKILKLFFPKETGTEIYLFLFLLLSPFFLRSGMVCMSDMTAAAAVTGFFYQAFAFRQSGKKKNLILLFVFGAAAVMIRYSMPVILIAPTFFILPSVFKKENIPAMLLGILLAAILLLPHFLIRHENSGAFLNHPWLGNWSFVNYFHSGFDTPDGRLQFSFINILYSAGELFHPGYFLAGILFLPLLFWRGGKIRTEEKLLFVSIGIYLLFLSGMPVQNSRFFIPVVPLVVIAAYRGYQIFCQWLNEKRISLFVQVVIVSQLLIFAYGFKLIIQRSNLEESVFVWMEKNTRQKTLYSFDLDVALKGKGLKKDFNNLFEKNYEAFEPNSLVLFNPGKFSKQWAGKNPMLNWEKLKSDYQLVQIHTFGEGWELYEIR